MNAQGCTHNKRLYSVTSDAKKYLNDINASTDNISGSSSSTEKGKNRKGKTHVKSENVHELKEGDKDKSLHSKYPICADDPDVNSSLTHQWLPLLVLKS